jgi:hypothetical protein
MQKNKIKHTEKITSTLASKKKNHQQINTK